jgi:uncharacterized protein (DUF1697 family)
VSIPLVALLRGINVGRAKRIAMADLRVTLERLGYGNVRTLLNSGNVVFTPGARVASDPARRIEKAVAAELGVAARVIVIDAQTLAAAVAGNPLSAVAARDPSHVLLAVPADAGDLRKLAAVAAKTWSPEQLAVGPSVAYLWCPRGIAASQLVQTVSRTLDDAVTMRNVATMSKLLAMARGPA